MCFFSHLFPTIWGLSIIAPRPMAAHMAFLNYGFIRIACKEEIVNDIFNIAPGFKVMRESIVHFRAGQAQGATRPPLPDRHKACPYMSAGPSPLNFPQRSTLEHQLRCRARGPSYGPGDTRRSGSHSRIAQVRSGVGARD